MIERLQAIADRNIRRFGLLADESEGADLPGDADDAAGLGAERPEPTGQLQEDSNLMRLLTETHGGPR